MLTHSHSVEYNGNNESFTSVSSCSSSRSYDTLHDSILEFEEFIKIEYDVFFNLLLLVDKRGKLGMTDLWSCGLSQIKLRVSNPYGNMHC